MDCVRCFAQIRKGQKYHRTRLGAHHAECPPHEVGRWYWVRFKQGIARAWQPGQVRKDGGLEWVALIYNTAHYGVSHFEFGEEIAKR